MFPSTISLRNSSCCAFGRRSGFWPKRVTHQLFLFIPRDFFFVQASSWDIGTEMAFSLLSLFVRPLCGGFEGNFFLHQVSFYYLSNLLPLTHTPFAIYVNKRVLLCLTHRFLSFCTFATFYNSFALHSIFEILTMQWHIFLLHSFTLMFCNFLHYLLLLSFFVLSSDKFLFLSCHYDIAVKL